MFTREEHDTPTSWQTRTAQYDAVCEWGIPNHSLLQRLEAIEVPVFVANARRTRPAGAPRGGTRDPHPSRRGRDPRVPPGRPAARLRGQRALEPHLPLARAARGT